MDATHICSELLVTAAQPTTNAPDISIGPPGGLVEQL
jgi:hypothetical protein